MSAAPRPPVIIIGAARSGTNMLRNVLTSLPGFETWPCDEIPFIWKHGLRHIPHDEFTPDLVTPKIRFYLERQFAARRKCDMDVVVEKTCANSLRLAYVAAALPSARFVIIVRNAYDTIASAMLRWTSSFDLRYSLAKARYVPMTDLPYYGLRYLGNRIVGMASRERKLGQWGPIFAEMSEVRRHERLPQLAARQWVRCMQRTLDDIPRVEESRRVIVRYEDFVTDPQSYLNSILSFLDQQVESQALQTATASVRKGSVGKGLRDLSAQDRTLIEEILSTSGLSPEFLPMGGE